MNYASGIWTILCALLLSACAATPPNAEHIHEWSKATGPIPPPMQEGRASSFEYAGTDGAFWTAHLTPTDVNSEDLPWQSTTDSQWRISQPPGPETQYEWIWFKTAADGSPWRAKVHCEYQNQLGTIYIATWFEFERQGGVGNHTDSKMEFLDRYGNKWQAVIQPVPRYKFPSSPDFILSRIH